MTHDFSRILVAGGAGFIGSHIVDALLQKEIEVTVLDNLYAGKLENLTQHKGNKNLKFVEGDVRNLKLVRHAVKGVDAVFNEAAVVSVGRSIEDPLLVNEVNVTGTLNLLKASLDSGVKRFIQASSASIYGDTQTLPIHEDLPPKPIAPYAVAEFAAESYARVFCKTWNLQTVCLRYFNVYGPRQVYSPYSGVITIFMNQILKNQQPIIFGDGNQTRDFVFVGDVVNANMLALTMKEAKCDVLNIATGKAITLNELFKNLREIMGKRDLKPVYEASRAGDILHSYASIEKAESILGYRSMFSLKEGLTRLVQWHTSRH